MQIGTPEELFERPAHTFVGYFIGSPGMNVLPAEVEGRQARIAGHALGLDKSYGALPAGARIEIGIRPEFVAVAAPAPGLLAAEVERIDDLGRSRIARLRVGNLKLAARMPKGLSIAGSAAGLVFDPAQIHVYADSRRVEGTAVMEKIANQKAWLLVLPVFALVAFSAVIPLMTVVNYSVQDTFGNNKFFWNGIGWYQELLDPSTELGGRFFASLWRNLAFSAIVLAIEMPLGIVVALAMPRDGWGVAFSWSCWRCRCSSRGTSSARSGRSSAAPTSACWATRSTGWAPTTTTWPSPLDAWLTIIAMDVWHWTQPGGAAVLRRPEVDPRRVLPGGLDRRRVALGGVPRRSSCPR